MYFVAHVDCRVILPLSLHPHERDWNHTSVLEHLWQLDWSEAASSFLVEGMSGVVAKAPVLLSRERLACVRPLAPMLVGAVIGEDVKRAVAVRGGEVTDVEGVVAVENVDDVALEVDVVVDGLVGVEDAAIGGFVGEL